MVHIRKMTTLESIRAERPETVYYSFKTRWWTHRAEDLRTLPNGLPCDPRGSVLMQCDAEAFLASAESDPSLYGRHGLATLLAAHNDNCVVSEDDLRNTCLVTWDEYNDLLDEQDG